MKIKGNLTVYSSEFFKLTIKQGLNASIYFIKLSPRTERNSKQLLCYETQKYNKIYNLNIKYTIYSYKHEWASLMGSTLNKKYCYAFYQRIFTITWKVSTRNWHNQSGIFYLPPGWTRPVEHPPVPLPPSPRCWTCVTAHSSPGPKYWGRPRRSPSLGHSVTTPMVSYNENLTTHIT